MRGSRGHRLGPVLRALGSVRIRDRGFLGPRGKQKLELNWYEPGSKYATPYATGQGLDHLAFRTGSLSKAKAEFRKKGVKVVDRYVGPKGGEWFYIADPDGIWIEINGAK